MVARCSNAECDVEESNVCVDGFALSDCRNRVAADDIDDLGVDAALNVPERATNAQGVALLGGGVLDQQGADAWLRANGGRLIALVAGHGTGKTTLMAMLYELVRRRLLPLQFMGSETLRGFEQRVHLARQRSGSSKAQTPRTRLSSLDFLHLNVGREGKSTHLLFCDRAGEVYERALDSPPQLSLLPELVRADVIAVVVDGRKLKTAPHVAIGTARRAVLALTTALPAKRGSIGLLVTKADLWDNPSRRRAEQLIGGLVEEFGAREIHVRALFVGSRAVAGNPHSGLGYPELIDWLLEERRQPDYVTLAPDETKSAQPFNRLVLAKGAK